MPKKPSGGLLILFPEFDRIKVIGANADRHFRKEG